MITDKALSPDKNYFNIFINIEIKSEVRAILEGRVMGERGVEY